RRRVALHDVIRSFHGGGCTFDEFVFGEPILTNRTATAALNLQLSLGHAHEQLGKIGKQIEAG
ncbi:MAG: hypothetical protein ACJ746_27425, partial [Bryobacteraceae bacterium]